MKWIERVCCEVDREGMSPVNSMRSAGDLVVADRPVERGGGGVRVW